ncbi:GSU2403 family nucleotidyltransferase fold protein, partial [Acinetobacter baumannii]
MIGTHAFLALGNMLGVRWSDGAATLDVDFAHAGRNISVALPASIKLDVHGALESLEMGLLPITQFNGLA